MERSPIRRVAGLLFSFVAFACVEPDVEMPANAPAPAHETPAAQPTRPGIPFDPAAVQPGDTIGTLVLEAIDAQPTVVDSTLVGTARFRGSVELTGSLLAHFDADLRDASVCFEADEASAARLPRWEHDERRPWFCFTNPEEARRALEGLAEGAPVTVVIDELTVHRNLSDAVNAARFVRRAP